MKSKLVLLFDLGGVLIESAGRQALRLLLPQFSDENEILVRWHASSAVSNFERGHCTPQAFARAFIEDWSIDLTEDEFLRSFASWVKGFYPGARQLLTELRPRYRLACLSNTNLVHWEQLRGVEDLFDYTFLSYRSGFMKPEARAYKEALEIMQVDPQQVHFFDDLRPNIEGAINLGINSHHVAGVAETRAALRAAGLHG